MTDEEKRRRALVNSIVSSSPDKVDNDDGFADFLTLLATPATISKTTPLNKKNDTNNKEEDVEKDIVNETNTKTTATPNTLAEEEQRIKQFNKTLEQIMIRREDGEMKKNGKKQQPTALPEAFYKSYSMTLPKTLKGSSKKK